MSTRFKTYTYSYLLNKEIHTSYQESGDLVKEINYEYNDLKSLSKKEIDNSSWENYVTHYKYITDLILDCETEREKLRKLWLAKLDKCKLMANSADRDACLVNTQHAMEEALAKHDEECIKNSVKDKELGEIYDVMVKKNILNPLLEETVIATRDGVCSVVSSQLIEYNDIYKPRKILNFNNTGMDKCDFNSKYYLSDYSPEAEYLYTAKGKIQEIKHRDGTSTIYLWSYGGQYPVMEINGVGFNEFLKVVSATEIERIEKNTNPDIEWIHSLADGYKRKFPQALISSYTFQPLVGISSQSDPRGIIIYYNYDELGRLTEYYIKENRQKKVLQAYDYHYGE